MNRKRFRPLLAPLVLATGVSFSACGGESQTNIDDPSAGDAGEPSSTGGTSSGGRGGTTSTGGRGGTTSTGGSSTGGTATGGTGGMIDGMCDEIMPCGGDPEGTWNVRENCAEVLVPIEGFAQYPGCENILGMGSGDIEGTFTFAGGVMTQDIVVTTFVTVTIDDACAQGIVGSPDITSADLCPLLDAQFMSSPDTPGSCVPTTAGCQCQATQPPMPSESMGAYTIMGEELVGADGTSFDFCQDGDELHLHGYTADAQTGQVVALTLLLDRI
jgi:hypothetical protein